MSDKQVELVVDARAELGEGPVWDYRQGYLYWVDIRGARLHVYDPSAEIDRTVDVGEEIGFLALRASGGLILGLRSGFAAFDLEEGTVAPLVDPERHLPGNRFNDGKCDPAGRLWAGTMSTEGRADAGSLYCLYPDMSLRTMVTAVSVSNGLAWTADRRSMYYIDTPTRTIAAYDYDAETGEISGRRVVVTVPEEQGSPDGMTIDRDGMLWVALWGGGRVCRWDPSTGRLLETIQVPAPRTTSCAFGGLRMDELYITSARTGLEPDALRQNPASGGLFRVRPGARGVAEPLFAG